MMPSSVWGVNEPRDPQVDPPLFGFDGVSVRAGAVNILEGVTAVVPDDGVTAVVGPSGAGKSTLLRLCNRLAVPTAGRVLFRGSDVAQLDPLELRRTVGMVFQRPTLFPGTVRDNLEVAAPGLSDAEYTAALAESTLDPELLERAAQDLSGGEAQRVCLARTLLAEPEVLLMDEPTSAVDNLAREVIERRVLELAAAGTPVVLVTHDLGQMRRLCARALVLVGGRLLASGSPEELTEAADLEVRRFLTGGT